MTIGKVLVLLLTSAFVVNGDFYLNLYDRNTKKYLCVIGYSIDAKYIKASEDEPDTLCKFNFVTSKLSQGKVLFQTNSEEYFNVSSSNYVQPKGGANLTGAEFDFIMRSDLDRKSSARIALRAVNSLYLSVTDDYFVKASSSKPVYFYIYPID